MKKQLLYAVVVFWLTCGSFAVALEALNEPTASVGVIRHVTLYRDRALVTREIQVPQGTPLRTIDVPDLPETGDPREHLCRRRSEDHRKGGSCFNATRCRVPARGGARVGAADG